MTYTPVVGTVLNAGSGQALTVNAAATTDYNPGSDTVYLNVTPALLTVTANNQAMVYGSAVPSLTGTLSGVVNGDGIAASYSTTASSSSDVKSGGYAITASLSDPNSQLGNYTVTNNAGTLTIAKASQSISWANPAAISYGTALSGSQLDAADTVVGPALAGALTYSPATGAVLNAGSNQALTVNAAATTDYNAIGDTVYLTITPGLLTLTANNQTMVYGSTIPTLTGTLSGVVNGDNITASYSTTASSSSDVKSSGYAITASLSDPNSRLSNYTVTNTPGTLAITKAGQTISWVTPAAIVYGTPLTGTQLDATDIVVGPAAAGALTYSPVAGTVLNAGAHQALTVNAVATTDYNAANNTVYINVTPALLTVAVNNQTMVYGSAVPTLTGTLSGVVNGDSITASYTSSATSSSDVKSGGYGISASLNDPNSRLSNYTVTNTPGTLIITKANQSLSWSNPTAIVYGTVLGSTQLNAVDSVVGPAAVGALTYSPPAGTLLNAGNLQTLTVTAAATIDYNLAAKGVTINVNSAVLTVTAANQTMVYGSAVPTLTGTLSGVVNGDNITASYSTIATSSSNVVSGGYAVTATLSDPSGRLANYTVINTSGTLTISKANQTISWTPPTFILAATPLSSTQLDATVAVSGPAAAGILTFTPGLGTVLNAGSQTLAVTAAATTDYNVATATATIQVIASGISVVGTTLYVVDTNPSSDQIQVNPVGSSNTGSTGLQVNGSLNNVYNNKSFSQLFTNIVIIEGDGNENIQLANSLSLATSMTAGNGNSNINIGSNNVAIALGNGNNNINAGNGNDPVTLGGGNNNVNLGNGNDAVTAGNGNSNLNLGNGNDPVSIGSGNNNVNVGNGNDPVTVGGGNNNINLGNGNDAVTAGNGNDNINLGFGNNTVMLGNGNDNTNLGSGNNVVVEGSGNDNINAGNGNNLIVAGLGQHNVSVGNGRNILIDGNVQLTQNGDSLRQVLNDWTTYGALASNVASIRSRLAVTDNAGHANHMNAGSGLDWFWATFNQDSLNRKTTDLLN